MDLGKHMRQTEEQVNGLLAQYERAGLSERETIRAELERLAEETIKLFDCKTPDDFLRFFTLGQNPERVLQEAEDAHACLGRIVDRIKAAGL